MASGLADGCPASGKASHLCLASGVWRLGYSTCLTQTLLLGRESSKDGTTSWEHLSSCPSQRPRGRRPSSRDASIINNNPTTAATVAFACRLPWAFPSILDSTARRARQNISDRAPSAKHLDPRRRGGKSPRRDASALNPGPRRSARDRSEALSISTPSTSDSSQRRRDPFACVLQDTQDGQGAHTSKRARSGRPSRSHTRHMAAIARFVVQTSRSASPSPPSRSSSDGPAPSGLSSSTAPTTPPNAAEHLR